MSGIKYLMSMKRNIRKANINSMYESCRNEDNNEEDNEVLINDLKKNIENYFQKIDSLIQSLPETFDLDDVNPRIESLNQYRSLGKVSYRKLQSILQNLKDFKNDLIEANYTALVSQVEEINLGVMVAKNDSEKAEAKAKAAQEQAKAADEKAEATKTEVAEAQANAKAAQEQAKAADDKAEAVKTEVAEAEAKAKAADEKAEAIKTEVAEAQAKAKAADEKAEAIKTEVAEAQANAKSAQEQAKAADEKAEATKTEVAEAQANAKSAQEQAKAADEKAEATKTEVAEAQANAKSAQEQAKAADDKAEATKTELTEAQANAKSAQEQAKAADEKAEATKTELTAVITTVKEEVVVLKNDVNNLSNVTQIIDEMKDTISGFENMKKDFNTVNETLANVAGISTSLELYSNRTDYLERTLTEVKYSVDYNSNLLASDQICSTILENNKLINLESESKDQTIFYTFAKDFINACHDEDYGFWSEKIELTKGACDVIKEAVRVNLNIIKEYNTSHSEYIKNNELLQYCQTDIDEIQLNGLSAGDSATDN